MVLRSVLVCLAAMLCGSGLLARGAQSEDSYSANKRILKIRDLGKRGPSALPALSRYLSDPDRDIRAEAVRAIVKIGTPQSLDLLVQAAHDGDSEVQIRATDGIVNVYVPGYVARGLTGPLTRGVRQMKGFFASRNDQVIDPSVTVRPDADQAITDQIGGGSSVEVKANAARAAGILLDVGAVPALVQALHGKDGTLIFESLVALQKIHDPSAGPGVSFLAHDLDERIQSTALETIGDLRSLDSAPDVRSAFKNARSQRIRRAAMAALAMLGIPGDRPLFQQYAADSDPVIRSAALEGLGRIREPEDFPVLEKAYDEPDADWRIHLAGAFGMVNQGKVDTAEFSPLTYLMEEVVTKGRSDAASAYLKELARKPDVRQALEKLAPQASKAEKLALCPIFASTGEPDVEPVLNQMAGDIDSDVAFAASRALNTVKARSPR